MVNIQEDFNGFKELFDWFEENKNEISYARRRRVNRLLKNWLIYINGRIAERTLLTGSEVKHG